MEYGNFIFKGDGYASNHFKIGIMITIWRSSNKLKESKLEWNE